MSTGFEVQIDALRSAAAAARDIAGQVKRSDAADGLQGGTAAIPGATAVPLMTQVASAWRNELAAWATATTDYGTRLETCATTYEHSDTASREAFPLAVLRWA